MEGNMENQHEEDAHNRGGGGRANHAGEDRRVLSSYINPNPGNCGSSIQKPTIQANNFELKPQLITLVQNNSENDYFYASERGNTRGVIELNNVDPLLAQNKLITKQLADLTKKMERNQVAAITTSSIAQEGVAKGGEGDLEQANYIGNSPRQSHDPYSKTYNPGWRNHPNFGWGNQQDQSQEQRRYNPNNNAAHQQLSQRAYQHQNNTSALNQSSIDERFTKLETLLEGICKDNQDDKLFKEEVRANIKNQGESIKKLEYQVGCLVEKIPKPTDIFPSDTEKNPRGEAKKVRWEDCKMVTTSDQEAEDKQGKQPNQPANKSKEEAERDHQEPEISQQELLRLYAPFSQLLKGVVGTRIYSRFLDLFASLNVNIPFIKAIQQMPAFIKYMKELLPRKSSLKGGQTIVMNKECSTLIQPELPTKRRDPGSFHILCVIGETFFDKALCDLGASINLLPLSLVKRLQINEILPTDVVIRLADKTQK
ncbi:uncharacterized protein LOC130966220 [Arachis stenosperma]|uniref:uncharacterized protein LOC130966220 n=1 Tax=Arachis stenosperma TaxID=217475 RepID=UPI0025AB9B3E|nr:uncharacterized protein LOC130966220 [Arachis stenosperma]